MNAEQKEQPTWRIMGSACTWSGPLEKVGTRHLTYGEIVQIKAKGGTPPSSNALFPCCPHCQGPVGKIEEAHYWDALDRIADKNGIPRDGLREMVEWAGTTGRCFKGAPSIARAYGAHLKRTHRALKRVAR